jgi:hypothetical protein
MSVSMTTGAGGIVESHAIVLGSFPYQEADRLVKFLSIDHGKITAYAPSAQRSIKRFGAAIEPMCHVVAQLRVPRLADSAEAPMWRLQKVDLKQNFMHLRKSYASLEAGVFGLRLVSDLLPEGPADPSVFKALGRYLRDSEPLDFARHRAWCEAALWTWFAHHLGFGDLSQPWEERYDALGPSFWKLWHGSLAAPEPDFRSLFQALLHPSVPVPTQRDEIALYENWVERSGMHWDHFSKCMQNRI